MIEGPYYGRVISAVSSVSKNSGGDQVVIECEVTHGAEAGDWVALPQPIKRHIYLSLTGGAWEYSIEKMKAIGFTGDFDDIKFNDAVYDGLQINMTLDTYKGRQRERWELPYKGMEPVKADADRIARMSARYRAEAGGGQPPPPSPAEAPKPVEPEAEAPPVNPGPGAEATPEPNAPAKAEAPAAPVRRDPAPPPRPSETPAPPVKPRPQAPDASDDVPF